MNKKKLNSALWIVTPFHPIDSMISILSGVYNLNEIYHTGPACYTMHYIYLSIWCLPQIEGGWQPTNQLRRVSPGLTVFGTLNRIMHNDVARGRPLDLFPSTLPSRIIISNSPALPLGRCPK